MSKTLETISSWFGGSFSRAVVTDNHDETCAIEGLGFHHPVTGVKPTDINFG